MDRQSNRRREQTMNRFIPYEKLSKKEKKKLDRTRRRGWGEISPVTRVSKNKKAYSRKGRREGDMNPDDGLFLLYQLI